MARTRQKSKQRKAKRLEQEQRATGRSPAKDAAAAVDEAIAEPSPAAPTEDGGATEVAEPAADQPAAAASSSPGPVEAAERAPARRPKPASKDEKARQRPARSERGRQKGAEPRRRNRVVGFISQVWAELQRVQWPNRNQVTQATTVVIVFCFLAGLYLGMWDFVFNRLVKALL